jgi:hypothetical protein
MDAEVAYSRISDVFGAGAPPVIKRRYSEGQGDAAAEGWETWQPAVPRSVTAIEWTGGVDPQMDPGRPPPESRDPEALFTTPQGQLIGLTDKAATGRDRHMGNWMVQAGPDGERPVPIDNSNARFQRGITLIPAGPGEPARGSDSPFALRLDPARLADQHPAAQWDQWQAGLEALQPEFDGLSMNEELANVAGNYAEIRALAGR